MFRLQRGMNLWIVIGIVASLAGLVVPLVVLGGSEPFTATPYSDVIRFEAQGVASLQVEIFDLSGRRLWDSGVIPGPKVDWNRSNLWGERLAYGTYLYQAKGWDGQGKLALQKSGKLVLLPGDKVQLQAAPVETESSTPAPTLSPGAGTLELKGGPDFGSSTLYCGHIFVTPSTNTYGLWIVRDNYNPQMVFGDTFSSYLTMQWYSPLDIGLLQTYVGGTAQGDLGIQVIGGTASRVAIGASTSPGPKLYVYRGAVTFASWYEGASNTAAIQARNSGSSVVGYSQNGSGVHGYSYNWHGGNFASHYGTAIVGRTYLGNNILELWEEFEPPTSDDRRFAVSRSGTVYADGSYTGPADFAELMPAAGTRSDFSEGDVLTIGPNGQIVHSSKAFDTAVAGVFSPRPGFLGDWRISGGGLEAGLVDDESLVAVAVMGIVRVKVTAEGGPIQPGDLLVTAATPGHAMRCDPAQARVGTVIGKALEPLEGERGLIKALVTLR